MLTTATTSVTKMYSNCNTDTFITCNLNLIFIEIFLHKNLFVPEQYVVQLQDYMPERIYSNYYNRLFATQNGFTIANLLYLFIRLSVILFNNDHKYYSEDGYFTTYICLDLVSTCWFVLKQLWKERIPTLFGCFGEQTWYRGCTKI